MSDFLDKVRARNNDMLVKAHEAALGAAKVQGERDAVHRRTAEAAVATSESLGQVIEALNASLEVARNAKADADRAQRLSTGIAWGSLAVAVASLAVAIIAIVVTLG
ncbi:MAG: hypothetical protein BGO95_06865 [Micrococcales bacterium 73-13]|nr:MAG: hypothetical protein BGO95_06865 [Micrococcales bacterium 73-13]